jgi:hypothetical protein
VGVLERPRYFPRQLITPDDLTLEANYFRDRLRRHNRYLHGWGVVCGALVGVVAASGGTSLEPWLVAVQPGYVLGPYGDEIMIDRRCEVSIRTTGVIGCGNGHQDLGADPWCQEVYVDRGTDPVYVAVRYREFEVRPVLSQPAGCGCDEMSCEYSRFSDGYEIGILDHCPGSHVRPTDPPSEGETVPNPVCPACADSPWVVLAKVSFTADGTITTIDNCACRRIVSSARDEWLSCSGETWSHDQVGPGDAEPTTNAGPTEDAGETGTGSAEPVAAEKADTPTPRPRRRSRTSTPKG